MNSLTTPTHMKARPELSLPSFATRCLALTAALFLGQSVHAADGTWILDGPGTWDPAVPGTTLWSGNIVAQNADFTADFSTIDITANRTVTLGAPVTIGNLKFGDTTGSQTWTLAGGNTLTLDTTVAPAPTLTVNNSTATISAALAGGDGLIKAGAGRLILSGGHTFSGLVTVNAGTLDLLDTANAYTNDINLAISTATLDASNTANSTVITVNGNISGAGRINKGSSTSTLVLNGNNDFTGGTTLTAGSIMAGSGTNNGIGTGTLTLSGGAFLSSDNSARTFNNALSMGSNPLRLGALQGAVTGLGDLNFTSTGSISIGGSKTWTVNNATTVTFNNPWTGNSGWNVTKAGTGTLVFNGNLNSTGVGVVVSAGKLTLNGAANSYTGATTVNAGTLLINGAKTGAGVVTINNSGTLGGAGSVAGALTLAIGGSISPGSGTGNISTLSVSDTTWNGDSGAFAQMKFDLSNTANQGLSATSDTLALTLGTGVLTKGTSGLFEFDFGNTGAAGNTYTLMTFAGSSGFAFSDFSYSALASGLTGTFALDSTSLKFTVVPEPNSSLLLLSGLAMFLVARRQRSSF